MQLFFLSLNSRIDIRKKHLNPPKIDTRFFLPSLVDLNVLYNILKVYQKIGLSLRCNFQDGVLDGRRIIKSSITPKQNGLE